MEEVEQGNQMPLKPTEMLEEVISELKSRGFDLDEMENQLEWPYDVAVGLVLFAGEEKKRIAQE